MDWQIIDLAKKRLGFESNSKKITKIKGSKVVENDKP